MEPVAVLLDDVPVDVTLDLAWLGMVFEDVRENQRDLVVGGISGERHMRDGGEKGKTSVVSAEEARGFSTLVGLRNPVLTGVLAIGFARITAEVPMRVAD